MTLLAFLQSVALGNKTPCPGCGSEWFLVTISISDFYLVASREYGSIWPRCKYEGSCPICFLHWLYDEKTLIHRLWYHESKNTFDLPKYNDHITRRKGVNLLYGAKFGRDNVIEGARWVVRDG